MQSVFQPGRTVWKVEHASRAAVLVDGAAFFAAVRAACLKARRTVFIVGWDIDSRTELVGDRPPDDGFPTNLAGFLTELVTRRPELQVHLLLWDYSLLYAHEREPMPRLYLNWQMPPQVTFCLDSTVPFGSSQHQKLVVVDDALAFSGGLDLTIRRWDTSRHDPANRKRVDPAGEPYRPFHDVQMMVDGEAARALALLARRRWCHARGGEPEVRPEGDPWPEACAPDFTDVEIAIARTQPRYHHEQEVREVEALFVEAIGRAERSIYIENQFTTCTTVAAALAQRLRERPELEVVIVAPRSHDSFVERRTMRNGRLRFWRIVKAAGGDRVRLLYPSIDATADAEATHTMIHSKIMVVDDGFLRVGSANINNRSMGADTECDLAIEARDDGERAAVAAVRNRLLGEHCGVPASEVAAALQTHGSLVRAADTLQGNGHRLSAIDDGRPDRSLLARLAERIADPRRPLRLGRLAGRFLPRLLFHGSRTVGRRLAKRIKPFPVVSTEAPLGSLGAGSAAERSRAVGRRLAKRNKPIAVVSTEARSAERRDLFSAKSRQIVERRSLHSASLREAPVETTGGISGVAVETTEGIGDRVSVETTGANSGGVSVETTEANSVGAAVERLGANSSGGSAAETTGAIPGGVAGMAIGGLAALIVALTLAWNFTGLGDIANPAQVRELLEEVAGEPWALAAVVAVFLLGSAIAFPVTILILATAAVFGPWLGMLYAAVGAGVSALVFFAIGARFGQDLSRRLLGRHWEKVHNTLRRRGLLAVVALRVVPAAPFTLANLAAGASSIRLVDFALGTLIGMGPGLAVLALMGDRIVHVLSDPHAGEIAVLALCVAGWIGLSFGAQALVSRFDGPPSDGHPS